MMTLVEYFVRHYTLVIDNTQQTYWSATRSAKEVVRSSDITRPEWLALSTTDRQKRFAAEIGEEIGALIELWCDEALTDRDHPGALLFREVSLHNDSDVQYALGCHYLPEDADIADLLEDDADDDDAEVTA